MGWREGVDENEMVGNAVYVPEDNQELEDLPEEDQEKAWLELQQVLRNIRSSQAAPGPQYNLGPEYSAEQEPANQDQIIFVSPEDLYLNKGIPLEYSPDILPRQEDLPDLPLYNFSPPEDLPLPDQDAYYPPPQYLQALPEYEHPVDKRDKGSDKDRNVHLQHPQHLWRSLWLRQHHLVQGELQVGPPDEKYWDKLQPAIHLPQAAGPPQHSAVQQLQPDHEHDVSLQGLVQVHTRMH